SCSMFGVMDGGACRAEFDRADESGASAWYWQHEISKHVRAVRAKDVLGKCQHDVGRAQLPSGREARTRWQLRAIAFRRSIFRPAIDRPNLVVGQSSLAGEPELAGLRLPRRHEPALRNFYDQRRSPPGIVVARERERAGAAVVMAWGAAAVQNRRHIFRERDGRAGVARRLRRAGHEQRDESQPPRQYSAAALDDR